MRIAIDLSPAVNEKAGLGRYAGTLAEHLVALDHRNEYIAFAHGDFREDALSPALQALPRANVRMDVRPFRMAVLMAQVLGVSLDRWWPKVEVFHATEHLLPVLKNSKTVFTLHDLIFRVYPQYHLPLNRWFLTNAMPYFLRRADAIIAVSECTKQDAIRLYDVPPEKIKVIYEGVSPALAPVSDPAQIRAVRAKYGVDDPFIFCVGTIEPRKNIPALVDAVRILRERSYPHRLLVSGHPGWLYQGVFDHVKRTGMESFVSFVQAPDVDLPALFAACDAFVYPSLYEGFGLPPLEAMACRAPVVCSSASSLPEVVGDAALLVNPQDVREIADATERVIRDESLRKELRAKGLARAAKFSWEKAARETLAVYEEVTAATTGVRS